MGAPGVGESRQDVLFIDNNQALSQSWDGAQGSIHDAYGRPNTMQARVAQEMNRIQNIADELARHAQRRRQVHPRSQQHPGTSNQSGHFGCWLQL